MNAKRGSSNGRSDLRPDPESQNRERRTDVQQTRHKLEDVDADLMQLEMRFERLNLMQFQFWWKVIMRIFQMMLAGVFVLALSACAASGPEFRKVVKAADNESGVYVYRLSRFYASGAMPPIYLDGESMGDLKNGGYLFAKVAPGPHMLQIGVEGNTAWWSAPVMQFNFESAAGENEYFEFVQQTSGLTFPEQKRMVSSQDVHGYSAVNGIIVSLSANVGLLEVEESAALQDLKTTRLSR